MSKELLEMYPMTEESYLALLELAITYQYVTGSIPILDKIKAKEVIGYSYFQNDNTLLNNDTDECLNKGCSVFKDWSNISVLNGKMAKDFPDYKFRRKIYNK